MPGKGRCTENALDGQFAGIRGGLDLGVSSGLSGVETAGVLDMVGTLQALPAPNAAVEQAPGDTTAPLLMQDPLNVLPWRSKAREVIWAVRRRSSSGLPY